jgi:CheY-like chemotaxis protein
MGQKLTSVPINGTAPRPTTPPRVLVVDDDASVREFVSRLVREAGYRTASACNGPDAIAVADKSGPFDLLLTDLMMPHMNGDELARRLRQREPALKVLYLTGYADRLFSDKRELWVDEAFLEKPCTADGLREAIALLMTGHLAAEKAS